MGQQGRSPAPVAYFRLRMDEKSVHGVYEPLVDVTGRHRSGGGFHSYIGIGDFFVSFASHEAADQFAGLLRARSIWFERTQERPTDIDAARLLRSVFEPRGLKAVLVIQMRRS